MLFPLVLALTTAVHAAPCPECVIQNVRAFAYPGICSRDCWKQVHARPEGKWQLQSAVPSGTYYVVDTVNSSWTMTGRTLSIVIAMDCLRNDRKWFLTVHWHAPKGCESSVMYTSCPPKHRKKFDNEYEPKLAKLEEEYGPCFEHHACRTVATKSHATWLIDIVAEDQRVLWSGAIEIR